MKAINAYLNIQARDCHTYEEFAKKLLDIVFNPSQQKEELLAMYQEAERNYIMSQAKKSKIQMPDSETPNALPFFFKPDDLELSPAYA